MPRADAAAAATGQPQPRSQECRRDAVKKGKMVHKKKEPNSFHSRPSRRGGSGRVLLW